jgi:3-oxoacyl-[acyl-carrier protein] reductase
MIDRKAGRIVNISSVAGRDGLIGNINYSASKGGIDAMTVTAARELGKYGIAVNAVAPGTIETSMTEWLKDQKFRETYIQKIALRRFGKPEDVARVTLFLASDDASYMTGQIIRVDGGRS